MDEQTPKLWTRCYYYREKIYRLKKTNDGYIVEPLNGMGKTYRATVWNRQWSVVGGNRWGNPDPLTPYIVEGGLCVY
jgi:hypothetical protein